MFNIFSFFIILACNAHIFIFTAYHEMYLTDTDKSVSIHFIHCISQYNGDWENCVRSQKCLLWRGLRRHCPMNKFLVSCILFNICLYFSYYMAGYLLDRPHVLKHSILLSHRFLKFSYFPVIFFLCFSDQIISIDLSSSNSLTSLSQNCSWDHVGEFSFYLVNFSNLEFSFGSFYSFCFSVEISYQFNHQDCIFLSSVDHVFF